MCIIVRILDCSSLFACFFFLMIRRPPRSTLDRSSAASDVYKRQGLPVGADGGGGAVSEGGGAGGGGGVGSNQRAAPWRHKVFAMKQAQVEATGAKHFVTSCGQCRITLDMGAKNAKWDKRAESLLELVAAQLVD